MKFRSTRPMPAAAMMTLVSLTGVAVAVAQTASQEKPRMAEETFKNVQVLKGIPVDDFMATMGIMSAATGFDCSECHVGAGFDKVNWEFDTPRKLISRKMVQMVATINHDNFQGRQVVTCWTCHRGRDRPLVTPTMETVYGSPVVEMDDIVVQAEGQPSADQILDKYIQAIGGAQKLAGLTSYVATGKSVGFGGFGGGAQVQVFAKAPDQRATIIDFVETPERGNSIRLYNGRTGWIKTPRAVLKEYMLGGSELDGARLDAQLGFPGQIKQVLSNLRVGLPDTINDHEVQVVQGNGPKGVVATLYFDKATGLLVRMIRFGKSPIGRVPTQVDYADYRDVGGIKIPFRWTFAWLDGRDNFEMSDVKLNVPIDQAKFDKPPQAK